MQQHAALHTQATLGKSAEVLHAMHAVWHSKPSFLRRDFGLCPVTGVLMGVSL